MDTTIIHPLLQVTQEEVEKIHQLIDLNDASRFKESLDAIEEWCKKQPHLVEGSQYINRHILERLYLLAKGSVEGTKNKIDKVLTLRKMIPELTLNKSIDEFDDFSKIVTYVPLPKLNPSDQSRVMVTQVAPDQWENFNLLSFLRYCFMIGEYRLQYDYTLSERMVIDLNNATINLVGKLNPVLLKKGEILCTEGYNAKIKGIHLLNAPNFVDRVVSLIKQGLKEKVARRVHVHSSYEELHKEISTEILPKEYGGDGPSCAQLNEQWKNNMKAEEARQVIENLNKIVVDESKRTSLKFNEEYLGMPGSFRKLTVD